MNRPHAALASVVSFLLSLFVLGGTAVAAPARAAASAHPAPRATATANAGTPANPSGDDSDDETDGDGGAAAPQLHWTDGPTTIDLGHGAQVAVPAGRQFLRGKEAVDLMESMGNLYNDNLLGLIISSEPNTDYLVTIRYDEDGYVKDDDAIDGKALLEDIQKGEPEYNEERKKRGFSPLHALGWSEDPRYDKASHEVVWALLLQSDGGQTVNLNTRVLGRRGYVAVNLMCDPKDLPRYRGDGLALVKATTFTGGNRYEDFDASKDKVAEYGLAGLILGGIGVGVAVKAAKVGLFAAFWKPILAFFIAAKKAVIALFIAIAAGIKKLFGRKPSEQSPRGTIQ
jgi:uncharacterized membrane-anchored protein